MSIWDDLGDLAEDVSKPFTKVIAGVGGVIISGGATIVDAIGDAAKAVVKLIGELAGAIAFRDLRSTERMLAVRVFGDNNNILPLDKILICSIAGGGGRPVTLPGGMITTWAWFFPGLGPAVGLAAILARLNDKYIIFAGPDGYNDGVNWVRGSRKYPGQVLIHELVHVWQGKHKVFGWEYVFNSLVNQCSCCVQNQSTKRAYWYTPGLQFRDYAAEKQAPLVEDWFVNTRSGLGSDPARDPYIKCNIRTGKPNADTIFPRKLSAAESILVMAETMKREGNVLISQGGVHRLQGQEYVKAAAQLNLAGRRLGVLQQANEIENVGQNLVAAGGIAAIQGRELIRKAAEMRPIVGRME